MHPSIVIIGLGASDIEQLPLGIYEMLMKDERQLFVRTKDHPVLESLVKRGLNYESFDHLYERETSFERVYEQIVQQLLKAAEKQNIIYAVPGHPMLAEKTVQLLLKENINVQIKGGQSYLDDLFTSLQIDPIEGFQFVDGTSFQRHELNFSNHIIFSQVYDQYVASHIKLTLLEDLPPNYEVTIVEAVGSSLEKKQTVPLVDLDRTVTTSNLLSVYVPPVPDHLLNHTFNRLRTIIAYLRGPDGCAWDRKQTHESLRPYVLEETYELIEAINNQDDEAIIEELGDLLLQVMLHSQIGEDNGYFTVDDVVLSITNKMIHRHPQIFGNEENAHKTWDELKREEKDESKNDQSVLTNIPAELPALFRAEKIQKRAAKVGFDWEDVADVWEKFQEELKEVEEAVARNDKEAMTEEFGDLIFVIVNVMRFYNIHAELALQACNEKFLRRFQFIENKLSQAGKTFAQSTLEEMDHYWEQAKERE
ncbi:MAG TPA: nucleoside triphosphate pyrophosphohydrolase [Bacillota bacterium]|nr:nucleoside triphosphate pyrophosphohydrolase [Bacillota bacterium]